MSTESKVSKKNPFYLDGFRYLELKNFCRQYEFFKRRKDAILYKIKTTRAESDNGSCSDYFRFASHIEQLVEDAEVCSKPLNKIDKAIGMLNPCIQEAIFISVTKGLGYDTLLANGYSIPCGRKEFFHERRRFFWILSQIRDRDIFEGEVRIKNPL